MSLTDDPGRREEEILLKREPSHGLYPRIMSIITVVNINLPERPEPLFYAPMMVQQSITKRGGLNAVCFTHRNPLTFITLNSL